MRLSTQCDSGGARARSEERALGLTPFSQFLWALPLSGGNRGEGTAQGTRQGQHGGAALLSPAAASTLQLRDEKIGGS